MRPYHGARVRSIAHGPVRRSDRDPVCKSSPPQEYSPGRECRRHDDATKVTRGCGQRLVVWCPEECDRDCRRLVSHTRRDVADVSQLAAGPAHVRALLYNGRVSCGGSAVRGQRGDMRQSCVRCRPALVSDARQAMAVASGSEHSCAPLASGSVVCWGDNTDGQFGNGESWVQPVSKPMTLDR